MLSLSAKAVTTLLGIIQSIIVVRILSPGEFGLVGLVMSVGGVIGVSQHLGIVDGAIREIAVLKKKREIGKVFWVSHVVRQIVTIPLSVGLLLLAGVIAQKIYNRPEITTYLQIFASVLVLQGLQDVLGATLTGIKKFKQLYGVQVATAAINIAVFGWLTWQFGVAGFFWAVVITTAVMVAWYFAILARELRGFSSWPSLADMQGYGRKLLRIGLYMYAARIFFVVWQRLPLLVLGGVLAAEELGYLNVSLTFGSRLTIIAMALAEVNLAWMSSLFVQKPEEFRRVTARNMQRVLGVMAALTLALLFFTPEILRYIIGAEYLPAQGLIYVMTAGFFLYALTDIGTSSVFVAGDKPRLRAQVYGLMMLVTGVVTIWLLATTPRAFPAALGVMAGAAAAYLLMLLLARQKFQVSFLTPRLGVMAGVVPASALWLLTEPGFFVRLGGFVLLIGYVVWEVKRSGLLPEFNHNKSAIKIVCFAGAAYDLPSWTNRQHIMSWLATSYPVLYVEPRVWILRRFWRDAKTFPRFLWRLLGWEVRANVRIISQWNLIPGSRENKAVALLNHYLNRGRVLLIMKILGFDSAAAWIYDTEAAEYLNAFTNTVVVYDCVDDHAQQAGVDRNPGRVREEENKILQRADLVTVTSKRLYELKKNKNKNVQLVLNAGDVELFKTLTPSPSPLSRRGARPVLGTVGALDSYKVDFELLEKLAKARPKWSIVLIGNPIVDKDREQLERLASLPNIKWLGEIERTKVPAYVKDFDVCLIPYRLSAYNEASFPLKFWEFMATGKPIVVSGLPELREYEGLIEYAKSAEEFIQKCEEALKNPGQTEERVLLAQEHTWEKRASRLRELLDETIRRRV